MSWCLVCSWKKADEKDFPVPGLGSAETLPTWARKIPAEHIQALRQLGHLASPGPEGGTPPPGGLKHG